MFYEVVLLAYTVLVCFNHVTFFVRNFRKYSGSSSYRHVPKAVIMTVRKNREGNTGRAPDIVPKIIGGLGG